MQPFTPGWNDPPSLAKTNSVPSSSVRSLLNKRVAFPISGNSPIVPQSVPLNPSQAADLAPFLPPVVAVSSEPISDVLQSNIASNGDEATGSQSITADAEANIVQFTNEEIMNALRAALESCTSIPSSNADGISKRLEKLQQAINQGSLSTHCRQKLCTLVNAVKEKRFTDAYNTHSAMMIEHFAEVNPWMVGVKALILECQKHATS